MYDRPEVHEGDPRRPGERRYETFFVVSGVDGAGKSTMLARLAKLRPEWRVGSYQPEDWLPHERLPHFDWALQRHPKTVVHRLDPLARAGFLLSMISSHWEYWIRPRLEAGEIVVMDSYYYRFYAKERVRGLAPDHFFAGLESLPSASALILADLPIARAASRKRIFDQYEVSGTGSANRDDFMVFQADVMRELESVCRRSSTPMVHLEADRSAGEVAQGLAELIEGQLSTPTHEERGFA